MQPGSDVDDCFGRVLELAPSCDPTSLQLTPAEGYLLSRIDGHTTWSLLREIGGLPGAEVDRCLERWIGEGVIRLEGEDSAVADAPAGETETAAATGIDEALLDPGLQIDLEVQRQILEFEAGLDRDYYTLLGVAGDAESRVIKRAYFRLSKEYHPDRFFRREIGHYLPRLERIFKKVLEAYEILSDPIARAEVAKSFATAPPPAPEPEPESVSTESQPEAEAPTPSPRALTPIERLRQRMPFRVAEGMVAERRRKAEEFFAFSMRSRRGGNHMEAASSLRLAIAFDPHNTEYKAAFADVQATAAEVKAAELLSKAASDETGSTTEAGQKEALRLYEEVLLYRPHDPEVNNKAAEVALTLERHNKAQEYAERALAHSPEVATYHVTLSRIFHASATIGHAINELETALELDPHHLEAHKLLAQLQGHRRKATVRRDI